MPPAPGVGAADEDGEDEGFEELEDEEDASFDVIGVAPSVYEALDLLGDELPDEEWLTELDEEEWAAEAAEFGENVFGTAADGGDGADGAEGSDGSDSEAGNEWLALLRGIQDPRRRSVVQLLCGVLGPMDFLTEEFAKDVYLGGVATRLPGARFIMLASAAPPHQEVAFAILELPPRGTPDPRGRALLRACAAGDVGALRAALGEGADVDTLDEYGATPLHHAVAARSAAAVEALLTAGADPRSPRRPSATHPSSRPRAPAAPTPPPAGSKARSTGASCGPCSTRAPISTP
ncbi:ankyrin repeat domain-containing protein [Streptomyces sp. NPDC059455]|uniref:ankyrin repeat domain-containing protein n=1 Tax=Streptomyces sp. NPDC059455 TaxID=3346837 RepID=UPI0036A7FB7F